MTHGRYVVTGNRQYRGHDPGTLFEAILDPLAERRAVRRGAIRLVERVRPEVEPGSFRLPKDWPVRVDEQDEHVSSHS
jgi:hypothetical protein